MNIHEWPIEDHELDPRQILFDADLCVNIPWAREARAAHTLEEFEDNTNS